jgi:2-polyprenyl-3-methyl-5-hydroxy-6-metoxy-1,4-benzoquinol methylase
MNVITDFPIAYESFDHIEPKGTANDNTRGVAFVQRVEEIADGRKIHFADLGCSGGGLVKDFLDRGHNAVGIEGSDYSQKNKRAEWATIPNNLFTADITKPFFIVEEGITGLCDMITAWDVLEHIAEVDLGVLITNIRNNLKTNGLFVATIATFEDHPHHVTLKEKDWWLNIFKKYKMLEVGDNFIGEQHLIRSSSFYIVLKKV